MNAVRTDLTVFARDYPRALILEDQVGALFASPRRPRREAGYAFHVGGELPLRHHHDAHNDVHSSGRLHGFRPGVISVDGRAPDGEAAQPRRSADVRGAVRAATGTAGGKWLERLAASYEDALPEDPEVVRARREASTSAATRSPDRTAPSM